MNVKDFANKVLKHGWMTRVYKNGIELVKTKSNGKIISILIKKVKDKFELRLPSYIYISKTAIFAPAFENEIRYCRSINDISCLYNTLRDTEIVDLISNWSSFVKINEFNLNVNTKEERKYLKDLQAK